MTVIPLFASDTTAALAWPVGILLSLGLLAAGSLFLIAKWGRRRWWGLLVALLPTIVGGMALLLLLLSEGALAIFYAIAAFPLLFGVGSLLLWARRRDV